MSDPGSDYLAVCQSAYDLTRELAILKDRDIGFEILLTPPRLKPPIMLIGYQPGNAKRDMPVREARNKGFEKTWPQSNTIVDGSYLLAQRLREIFQEDPDLLARSVALNAVFIRHVDVQGYEKVYSRSARKEILQFCLGHVKSIVDALEPARLMIIGLGTLSLFDRNATSIQKSSTTARTISRRGRVFGREALAVPHLSGSRITREDRLEIKDAVLKYCAV